ncbi:NPCBM/NEW2 domain-containing protein (plasmid) [Actinomadura sp. ATCC 31491]|uniref:NPCBM/NEW2 domain-containing protein n=1 Tax=Actinomadura luzonensis TaxID=2805427 RepID=A0ABT0GBN7_9ACTN|nr:NPCBM/NEW2 domain-containing protein [Actinomadura luzonensis]MCK2215247.1 NPCBM/NEW2 domain-containing protein [Actinomadura luzonensis]MCK2222025.1 NPCBM/NEW2 domain-containing protein [Actinomadura luzonensis]
MGKLNSKQVIAAIALGTLTLGGSVGAAIINRTGSTVAGAGSTQTPTTGITSHSSHWPGSANGKSLLNMQAIPLEQSTLSGGAYSVGSTSIGGKQYNNVLIGSIYSQCSVGAEYYLNDTKTFTAEVGMLDEGGSNSILQVEVQVDGYSAWSTFLSPGRPSPVEVSVAGKDKIALLVSAPCDGKVKAGWINPTLHS